MSITAGSRHEPVVIVHRSLLVVLSVSVEVKKPVVNVNNASVTMQVYIHEEP